MSIVLTESYRDGLARVQVEAARLRLDAQSHRSRALANRIEADALRMTSATQIQRSHDLVTAASRVFSPR